jgi:hypothetical protein
VKNMCVASGNLVCARRRSCACVTSAPAISGGQRAAQFRQPRQHLGIVERLLRQFIEPGLCGRREDKIDPAGGLLWRRRAGRKRVRIVVQLYLCPA